MTIEKFQNTRFGKYDTFTYHGDYAIYKLQSLDFMEMLVGLKDHDDNTFWVRCENVTHHPYIPETETP